MSAITENPSTCDTRFALTATRDAPSQARALVEATFIRWEFRQLIPDAKLITSELVTNASVATPGAGIWLLLAREPGVVLIGVWDSSPIMPKKRPYGPNSTSGWGLHIVAAIADHTDTFRVSEPRGKITWAQLTT